MYKSRRVLYGKLEQLRGLKLLVYATGDRPGMETQIHSEVCDFFVNHLDAIGSTEKIGLYLYTMGGNTLAGWSIVNLIRQFCEDFEVIVPSKAHSTGTLMCLGASRIVMTKQATLGPIDPSVNTPLNPKIEGGAPDARMPVSVEAIKGYIELAREEMGIAEEEGMSQVLLKLSDMVHPLVLGQVYRTRSQIQMLARSLIANQIVDKVKSDEIISFLCSESGSHDYTINRREARDRLGLTLETPDDELYQVIKEIYDDIHEELELSNRFDPNTLLGPGTKHSYKVRRCLLESIAAGSHFYASEGTLTRQNIQTPQGITGTAIQDQRTFEGWRHYNG